MTVSPQYALDLPATYVMSQVLKDSIIDFANRPARRKSYVVFEYVGGGRYEPRSILGRYLDVQAAASYISYNAGVPALMDLPDAVFPQEIKRLGTSFLSDLQSLSNESSYWNRYAPPHKATGPAETKPALTAAGKLAVRRLMAWYGFEGISQTTGLAKLVA